MTTDYFKDRALSSALQISPEVEIGICPVTDKELYFMVGDGRTYMFDTYGTCAVCNQDLHISAIEMVEGTAQYSIPIHYIGVTCKECYLKDEYSLNISINAEEE